MIEIDLKLKNNIKIILSRFVKTLEEARKLVEEFEIQKQNLVEKEIEEKTQKSMKNVEKEYGFITVRCFSFKVNLEVFKEFLHCNWYLIQKQKLERKDIGTRINGKHYTLYELVYKYYNKNYNKLRDGTIDHRNRNCFDCTIENLRAASNSLQMQNRKLRNLFGYTGVTLKGVNFIASHQNKKRKNFKYLEDAALYYNNAVIESYGLYENGEPVGMINEIDFPKRTPVKDFYDKKKLNINRIDNFYTSELISTFGVNPEWRDELVKNGISTAAKIKKKDKDLCKTIAKNLLIAGI